MSRSEVGALLVDICRSPGRGMTAPQGVEDELVAAARFHRVAPLVQVAHRNTQPQVAARFQADRLGAITMHMHACDALQQLRSALGDLEWATFKGPVYSEHAHPVPGLRTYNDVDVIVDPLRLREVTSRLRGAGWQVADYADMLRNRDVPGEMHWVSPTGVFIDLHWSMINMASRRRLFAVPTRELLERRRTVDLGGQEVWTLDAADTLVHGCLHAALAGANKLIYLVDVDMLARSVTDWDEIVARARSWGAQAQTALVLGRAGRLLGTPLPSALSARLEVPWSLRVLMRITDRLAPVQDGRMNRGLNKFVARAVRSTGPATAAAAARNGTRWARDIRTPGVASDVAERPRADEPALEVYLAAVESAARRAGATVSTPARSHTPTQRQEGVG